MRQAPLLTGSAGTTDTGLGWQVPLQGCGTRGIGTVSRMLLYRAVQCGQSPGFSRGSPYKDHLVKIPKSCLRNLTVILQVGAT